MLGKNFMLTDLLQRRERFSNQDAKEMNGTGARWSSLIVAVAVAIYAYHVQKNGEQTEFQLSSPHKYHLSSEVRWKNLLDQWKSIDNLGAVSLEVFDPEIEFRGLVAKRSIKPEERVFVIPREHIFNIIAIEEGSALAGLDDEVIKLVSSWANFHSQDDDVVDSILAMTLLYHRATSLKRETKFSVYVNSLPESAFLLQEFTEIERGYLEGTGVLNKALQRKEKIEEEYKYLPPEIVGSFGIDDYMWARDMVDTRAFNVKIHGRVTDSMIPIADLPNHDHDCGLDWDFVDEDDSFIGVATCAVNKGDEITISYGKKENTLLLANYGFALEENPYNCVELIILNADAEEKQERNDNGQAIVGESDIEVHCYLTLDPESKDSIECLDDVYEHFLELLIESTEDTEMGFKVQANIYMWEYIKGQSNAWIEFMGTPEKRFEEQRLLADKSLRPLSRFALICRRSEREVWEFWYHLSRKKLRVLPSMSQANPWWTDPKFPAIKVSPLLYIPNENDDE